MSLSVVPPLTYTSFYLILWSYKLYQNISYQWEERKPKINLKTTVSLLNLKTNLKLCFLSMIKCWKLILCIWNRRLCEVLNSQTAFWLIAAKQWPENSLISFKKQFSAKFPGVNGLKIMTEHATYFEKADHCTFSLFEKQQIIIVASEMEKVIICINDFLFSTSVA